MQSIQIPQQIQRPRRRNDIYAMTRDRDFIDGSSPFESDPFSSDQPFIGKKSFVNRKNPFGL